MTLPEIQELMQQKEFIEAEKLCRQILQNDTNNVEANILMGKIIANRGNYDDAISFYLELEERFSNSFDVHFLLGRLYEDVKGDFDNALKYYRKALSLDYRNSTVNYRIGNILNNYLYQEKDEDEAKRYYQNAVNGDKPIEDAYYNLAELEKSKRALVVLRHGLTYFPQSIKLNELLAEKYIYFFNNPAECLKVVREAMEKKVESEKLSYLAFDASMMLSQYQEAVNYLDLIEPESHKTDLMVLKSLRAVALMESGNFGKVTDLLNEVIENDLKNEIGYLAHFLLMCSCFRSGEKQKALNIFSDISPEFDSTDFLLMLIPLGVFDCSKYYSEAIDAVLKTSVDPKSTATAKGFRAIYLNNKLLEAEASIVKMDISNIDVKALGDDLRSVVEIIPDNIQFKKVFGEILFRLNEWFDSARYLILAQLSSDKDEYIDIKALDKLHGNKNRFTKFFKVIEELIGDYYLYEQRFAKFVMPDIVSFLFDKKDYINIVAFANRIDEQYWVKEKVLFPIAYAYSDTNNKKLAKKYYKEYLSSVGENQAVLNNLGNIYSEDGDYSEAEKLYARAVELGAEYAEKNLENLNQKRQKVEDEKRSLQRAITLYAQDSKSTRRIVANIYNDRLDSDLILFKSSQIVDFEDGDVNVFLQRVTDRKYFEIVDEHNLPFDGVVLRLNKLLIEQVQKELRDEQKEKFFEELSTSISLHNLEERYNYDDLLVSKLTVVNSQELRTLLERDLREVVLALATQSYKAATILCGSIVEAVLLDKLLQKKEMAMETLKRLREKQNKGLRDKEKKIEDWTLETLLDVAGEEKIISYNLFYWGNGIRGFRNLVHPGIEQRKELSVSKENAEIAWSIVKRLLDEIQK